MVVVFFFFQAEDGIRDYKVTGVQTCALPICMEWVTRWSPEWLPPGDVIVATAWQSAPIVAAAPAPAGRKFYLVQHYESLYHGDATTVDATYRLPLQTIVISTWLRDVLRERFGRDAEILVTPVDRALFHPVAAEAGTMRPRVLMLHHDYAWDGETALVARRRDVGDLAVKLERMVRDDALRRALAAAGQKLVTTAFDWDRAVERMERIFTG